MKRADVILCQTTALLQYTGGGQSYLIQANNGSLYLVYVDTGSDLAFRKSADGGHTWSSPVIIFAGTVVGFGVWYDRWSGLGTDYISIAYTESGGGDCLFRTINTGSSDALSTQLTILAGTSTATGGCTTIARSRGGNTYCRTNIDAGAEGGFFKQVAANFPNSAWAAALTIDETMATTDQFILLPGWAADTNDMIMIFWDASADEISRKIYDDSANSWGETSIATSMVDQVLTTAGPHFAAAVDITNSQHLLVAWSAIDLVNADLRCWKITEGAITETAANVVLNSTDDQGLAAISIDTRTGYWYVFYGGASGGAETYSTAINLYYKVSKDGGATWGSETKLSATAAANSMKWIATCPRYGAGPLPPPCAWHNDLTLDELMVNVPLFYARAGYQLSV